MTVLSALLPFIVVIGLLASRRASLLNAGLAALAVTLPLAWIIGGRTGADLLADGVAGAWLAWPVMAVLIGGVLFQTLADPPPETGGDAPEVPADRRHQRLFLAAFLIGPFAEAATGFGLGVILAGAVMLRLGVTGPVAAALALFSQVLVPWGALAVGTQLGAELAGVGLRDLGVVSAILTLPVFAVLLPVFWSLAKKAGGTIPARARISDTLWLAALGGALVGANAFVGADIAGLVATGPLILVRVWWDERPDRATWASLARRAAPYGVLMVALLGTRLVPGLGEALRGAWIWQPVPDLPAFQPLYHASFWLLVTGLAFGLARPPAMGWAGAGRQIVGRARVPVLATLVYVTLAAVVAAAGFSGALAAAFADLAGSAAILSTPIFAAGAGFLTGSNVASNALMMPIQIGLAQAGGADPLWAAGLQNVAGSVLTALSPMRVAMAAAVIGIVGQEPAIYRQAGILGMAVVAVLMAVAMALLEI